MNKTKILYTVDYIRTAIQSIQSGSRRKKSVSKTGVHTIKYWYESFLSIHKQISKRVIQNLGNRIARSTEAQIRNWFLEIDKYLRDNP